MYLHSRKIVFAVVALGIVGGVVFLVKTSGGRGQGNSSPPVTSAQLPPPPPLVHTANWYVAHPVALKADDARCGGDAASIPQAACQNTATADQRLLAAQLEQATSANTGVAKSTKPQTP